MIRICLLLSCSHERSEERLPDIMRCCEPFMEELSEIKAFNDIGYEQLQDT